MRCKVGRRMGMSDDGGLHVFIKRTFTLVDESWRTALFTENTFQIMNSLFSTGQHNVYYIAAPSSITSKTETQTVCQWLVHPD